MVDEQKRKGWPKGVISIVFLIIIVVIGLILLVLWLLGIIFNKTQQQIQVPIDDPWRNSSGKIVYANTNNRCIVTDSEKKNDIGNCDGNSARFRTYPSGEIKLDGTNDCVTINQDKSISILRCNNSDEQKWSYQNTGHFLNVGTGECITSNSTDINAIGGGLKAMPCNSQSGINTFKRYQITAPLTDPWRNSSGEIAYADVDDRCIVTYNIDNLHKRVDIGKCDMGVKFRTYPSGDIKSDEINCITITQDKSIGTLPCNNIPSQKWSYDQNTNQFINIGTGECITTNNTDITSIGGGLKAMPCDSQSEINTFKRRQIQIQIPSTDPWRDNSGEIVYANANNRCIETGKAYDNDVGLNKIGNCDGSDRKFRTYPSGQIKVDGMDRCVGIMQNKNIGVSPCDISLDQKWSYNQNTNRFINVGSGECITSNNTDIAPIGGGLKAMPCNNQSGINTFKRR